MPMAPEAFFLPVANGQRLCLYHPPGGAEARGAVLHLHPFAEEMNKSRRMTALMARAMAERGYGVLQIDLHGCGDSSGDFGDATWPTWRQDVRDARDWLRGRCSAPLWLWGLRAGCLLASEAAAEIDESPNLLFWQPVVSGKLFLQQFLRLKVAGEMLSGDGKGVMERLKQQLAAGRAVEIAGYSVSPALALGLEQAELRVPPLAGRLAWLELSQRPDATLAPAARKRIDEWQAAGHRTDSRIVAGPAFWLSTEIEVAPALIDATLVAMEAHSP
jgi:exosortase A-associated hydrolase 2